MIEAKRLRRLFERVFETRRNCDFEDIRRLLIAVGFRLGRHHVIIPMSKPVRRCYVEQVLDVVREVLSND